LIFQEALKIKRSQPSAAPTGLTQVLLDLSTKNKQPPWIAPVDINMSPLFVITPTQVVSIYGGLKAAN
jgi:hypothetical protein